MCCLVQMYVLCVLSCTDVCAVCVVMCRGTVCAALYRCTYCVCCHVQMYVLCVLSCVEVLCVYPLPPPNVSVEEKLQRVMHIPHSELSFWHPPLFLHRYTPLPPPVHSLSHH